MLCLQEIAKELEVIDSKLNQTSPIASLPLEIFIEIISLATAEYRASPPFETDVEYSLRPRRTPVKLSHVCRAWYTSISNAPSLWTGITLGDQKGIDRKWNWFAARANGKRIGVGNELTKIGGFEDADAEEDSDYDRGRREKLGFRVLRMYRHIDYGATNELLRSKTFRASIKNLTTFSYLEVKSGTGNHKLWSILKTIIDVARKAIENLDLRVVGGFILNTSIMNLCTALPALTSFRLDSGGKRSNHTSKVGAELWSIFTGFDDGEGGGFKLKRLAVQSAVSTHTPFFDQQLFPNLESLEVNVTEWTEEGMLLYLPMLDVASTRLRHYHIINCPSLSSHNYYPTPELSTTESITLIDRGPLSVCTILDRAIRLNTTFLNLIRLDLSFICITTEQLQPFNSANAPLLSTLILQETFIPRTDTSLRLPDLKNLRVLEMSRAQWSNNETLDDLVTKTPLLERLDISSNDQITGTPLMRFVRSRNVVILATASIPERDQRRGWRCTTNPIYNPTRVEEGVEVLAPKKEKFISGLVELNIQRCSLIQKEAVDWLRKSITPGGLNHAYHY
jgi:hypothetical protein